MMSFHVKTTSSAVSGAPSLQRRFFRNLKVHVLPSGEFVHQSARPGFTVWLGTSKFNRAQNINRPMYREDSSSDMRKLKVFGSRSSQMINFPPRIPGAQLATTGGSGNGWLATAVSETDCWWQPESPTTAIIM